MLSSGWAKVHTTPLLHTKKAIITTITRKGSRVGTLIYKGLLILGLFWASIVQAEFNVEVGYGNLSSEWTGPVILVQERFDDWLIGMGYVGEQWVTPDGEREWHSTRDSEPLPTFVDRNLFLHGQRLLRWKDFELGIGAAYFQNTNRALGRRFTVSSSIVYHFGNLSIAFRHFSNAGSGESNMGQDMLTLGYTF